MLHSAWRREARSNETVLFTRITASAPLETCLGPDDEAQIAFDDRVAQAAQASLQSDGQLDGARLVRKPAAFLSELDGLEPGQLVFQLGLGTRDTGPPNAAAAAVAAGADAASTTNHAIARLADWRWLQRRAERRLQRLSIALDAPLNPAAWTGARLRRVATVLAPDEDVRLTAFPDAARRLGAPGSEAAGLGAEHDFGLDPDADHGFLAPRLAGERRCLHSRLVDTGEAHGALSREESGDAVEELLYIALREAGVLDYGPDGVVVSGDAAALIDRLGQLPLASLNRSAVTRRKPRRRFGPADDVEDELEHAPRAFQISIRGRALLATFATHAPKVSITPNDRLFVLLVGRLLACDRDETAEEAEEAEAAGAAGAALADGAARRLVLRGVRFALSSRSELHAHGAATLGLARGARAQEWVVGGWQIGTVLDPAATFFGQGSAVACMLHVDVGWVTATQLLRHTRQVLPPRPPRT